MTTIQWELSISHLFSAASRILFPAALNTEEAIREDDDDDDQDDEDDKNPDQATTFSHSVS